jgi:hypothetical protein
VPVPPRLHAKISGVRMTLARDGYPGQPDLSPKTTNALLQEPQKFRGRQVWPIIGQPRDEVSTILMKSEIPSQKPSVHGVHATTVSDLPA